MDHAGTRFSPERDRGLDIGVCHREWNWSSLWTQERMEKETNRIFHMVDRIPDVAKVSL